MNLKDCYVDTIARKFVEILTLNAVPSQYKFEFWINDNLNHNLIYPAIEQIDSKNAAKVLIPAKKIVYGILR